MVRYLYVAFGNIIGLLCLGLIAITGLGAIIQSSEYIFNIIKYIGAIYLVYLGIKLILKKNFDYNNINNSNIQKNISSKKLFLQAFIVAISNPKAIVYSP